MVRPDSADFRLAQDKLPLQLCLAERTKSLHFLRFTTELMNKSTAKAEEGDIDASAELAQ